MPIKSINQKVLGWALVIMALAVALQVVPSAWAAPEGAELGQTVPRTPVPTWTPVTLPAPEPDTVIWLSSPDTDFKEGSPFSVGVNVNLLAEPPSGSGLRIKVDGSKARFSPDNELGQVSEDGTEIYFSPDEAAELDLTNVQLKMYFAEDVLPNTEIPFVVSVVDNSGGETDLSTELPLAPAVLPATGA